MISSAKIYVHDLNGGQVKVYDINERGDASLIIRASELNMGMYTYTLVTDGAIVDTKRMILTD